MSNNAKTQQPIQIKGSNDSDQIAASAAAEQIDAKVAADIVHGGAGDDWLKGGPGHDALDGGAGKDRVDGGAGDDWLYYSVGENAGSSDDYDGGSGSNTLVLRMSRAEWMRDDIQADVADFLRFLDSEARNANGLMNSKGYLFKSLGLQVRKVSAIKVLVDGAEQDPRDEPVTANDDAWTAPTEHSTVTGNVTSNDLVPDLVRTVELLAGPLQGGLVLAEDGGFSYDPGMAFDSLAEGQSAEVSFTYRVTDADRDSATAVARLTITGTNDAPIAHDDTASADEDGNVQVAVLGNDTDVDQGDTRSLVAAAIVDGLGTVSLAADQVTWTADGAYDSLGLGDTALVSIDYTVRDQPGATDEGRLTLSVTGSNDAPTVALALEQSFSEEEQPFSIDLLQGAADVDRGAVLKVSNLREPSGKGGWTLDGNRLLVDPHHFDDLSTGEQAILDLVYSVEDEHGASVEQTLRLNVEGFTDVPSLYVVASAGAKVNEILLQISSEPANNERIRLDFGKLPAGAVIRDAQGQDVSAGIAAFLGTRLFTLQLPADNSADAAMEIKVTGMRPDGSEIGSKSGQIDVLYQVASQQDEVGFGLQDQSIWASGPAPIVEWHEYVPIVGGIARVWNGNGWEETGTGRWSSGEISLVSAGLTAEQVKEAALAVPRQILQTAEDVFWATAFAVDQDIVDTYNAAVNTFNTTVNGAHQLFNKAVTDAKNAFDQAVNAISSTAADAANWAYNEAEKVAAWARQAHIDAWYWLFKDIAVNDAWNVYNNTMRIAGEIRDAALKVVEWTTDTIKDAAQSVYDAAVNAASWVRDETLKAAQWVFDAAKVVYEEARQAVYDGAKVILDGAKQVLNDIKAALDPIQGESRLDVKADLFAEVGLQVDFKLDSGSVDTEISYQLDAQVQHNQTTDVLAITPRLLNLTTGEMEAFNTISPNAQLKAVLLYDVGANLSIFLDSTLLIGNTVVFDLSPGSNGFDVDTSISTGGYQSDLDYIAANTPLDPFLEQVSVGEIQLINLDSRNLQDKEVPFVGMLTENILSVEVGFPTVETVGTAAAWNPDYFNEGGFINVDFGELVGTVMNHVNARLDLSPELREAYDLPSLQDGSIGDAFNTLVQGAIEMVFDAVVDRELDGMPIFLIDANDETSSALLHANFFPDSLMNAAVTGETARLGFYTAYGESNNLVKINIDIDQLVAVIVNKVVEAAAAVASSGASVQPLQAIPDINPLDLSFGIDTILEVLEIEKTDPVAEEIKKFLDINVGFEAADLDVWSALNFSQEFTLSVDDMEYLVTMEDGHEYRFAANDADGLVIADASRHDTNDDGSLSYTMELRPSAMFSNDTEFRLSVGYVLDFLKASLAAELKLPIEDELGISIPGLTDVGISLADISVGPLLRVQGDLDLTSADVFESRFAIDLGSAEVDYEAAIVSDLVTVIGVASSSEAA